MGSTWTCFLSTVSGRTHQHQSSQPQPNGNAIPAGSGGNADGNIVLNPDFSEGLRHWHPNFSLGYVVESVHDYPEGISLKSSGRFAVLTNRKKTWHCLEQNITSGIIQGMNYAVSARVGAAGCFQGFTEVLISLKIDYEGSSTTHYVNVGRAFVSSNEWEDLHGKFSFSNKPRRAVLYIEGPPAGVDLLVEYVKATQSTQPFLDAIPDPSAAGNVISNPLFEDGLSYWSARACQIELCDSTASDAILPANGRFFVKSTRREHESSGIQQDVTGKVQITIPYQFMAVVQISGSGSEVIHAEVQATLRMETVRGSIQHVPIAKLPMQDKEWILMQGRFLINSRPLQATISIEGPPKGIEVLVNSVVLKPAEPTPPHSSSNPVTGGAAFEVNIVDNNNLNDGVTGWFALGNCTLSYGTGAPHILPPLALESLGAYELQSGRCIVAANRRQASDGPAQMITKKLELNLTYQVSAWVRIAPEGAQFVRVKLRVDGGLVHVGEATADDQRWHEISGSFRIEEEPSKVMVYFEGPPLGFNLMVAGLRIFPMDRTVRFKKLKAQTDKIRQRNGILKFIGPDNKSMEGMPIVIKQTENSFGFGSCIRRTSIENEKFERFFKENFSWAVLERELQWSRMETQQGNLNFRECDELLEWCEEQNIETVGHSVFSEEEGDTPDWVRELDTSRLRGAVENRLTTVLSRYKDKFRNYNIINEMLHGSFYEDKLGKDFPASIFKRAKEIAPSATLFVNERNSGDGCRARDSPEKYLQFIKQLQDGGAPIGGIGIKGHVSSPVGSIVCSALDKLAILGLPIWLTELDVASSNDTIRAEDLEVVLREAFAHPAVDGIVLCGFWELMMEREQAHLVDANGNINEAGKRYLELRKEWRTEAHGLTDSHGEFRFRGFHGKYSVEACTSSGMISKTFILDRFDTPLVETIKL